MSIKYMLTTSNFFKEGPCGRVSHAKGFVEGLSENNETITLVSAIGASSYIKENSNINFVVAKKFFYPIYFVYETLKSIINRDAIVIRWRPILPFFFIFVGVFYKKIYFEVNSITGLNSNRAIIRNIVFFSIVLTARFFKIIVVSDSSKKQILGISKKCHSIYVMPNGFSAESLSKFNPHINFGDMPNLVYFGRKQDYYEWDKLYEILERSENIKLHVFGFQDNLKLDNIVFYGEFNHEELVANMNNIMNPILIIHPNDSETAKSGSPMKLFEYAYLNIPVIVGDSLYAIGKDFEEFLFYESGNKDSMQSVIEKTIQNYSECYKNSQELRSKVDVKYSWKRITEQWLAYENH